MRRHCDPPPVKPWNPPSRINTNRFPLLSSCTGFRPSTVSPIRRFRGERKTTDLTKSPGGLRLATGPTDSFSFRLRIGGGCLTGVPWQVCVVCVCVWEWCLLGTPRLWFGKGNQHDKRRHTHVKGMCGGVALCGGRYQNPPPPTAVECIVKCVSWGQK